MFKFDNPVFTFLGKMVDAFYISVLWIIFSIPVVTLGASTQALYYTVHKSLKGNRGYTWECFFGSFKDHIKDSIIITIILELLFLVITMDKRMMAVWMTQETDRAGLYGGLYYTFFVLQFFLLTYFVEVCCYRARFEQTLVNSLKNGGLLCLAYLPSALATLVILAVSAFVLPYIPFLIFFLPVIDALLLDLLYERIYRRFMSEEEVETEKEYDSERRRK